MTSTTLDTHRPQRLCPWWMGYLLASPIRTLLESPDRLLRPLVKAGTTAVDMGCAMGFFSLPLARMVGSDGRVVCVDVQPRMLSTLVRRARRRGLGDIIETRLGTQEGVDLTDLEGQADLVLAIHVVHETHDPRRFLGQCRSVLRPGGRLLLAEPSGHVAPEDFAATRNLAGELGFEPLAAPVLRRSEVALLQRPG